MKLAWNAIVKNESKRILRCMESLRPHISCYAVYDTQSTDGTPDLIKDFFYLHGIPGVIGSGPFENFSFARNAALALLRDTNLEWDYALFCDADMSLVVVDPNWLDGLDGPAYDMFQTAGILSYQNRRLAARWSNATYLGVTHEYFDSPTAGCLPKDKAHFVDFADGENRKDKFIRDIRLFKKAMQTEPNNVRYMYYLAQSYRDAGKLADAAKWYRKRIEAGGWDEEVWSAMECLASCHKDLGDIGGFVHHSLQAYDFRPGRVETLYNLARFYRERSHNKLAVMFAEAGMDIPLTTDALFVNEYVYRAGLKEEFAISAFYVPGKREKGFDVIDELSIAKHPYAWSRQLADTNMIHYMLPLSHWCPSFNWQNIEFSAEENWISLNPSITNHILPNGTNQLKCVVRTVNYRMDDEGRYLIRGPNGSVTNDNPINTRNYLVPLTDDLRSITQIELVPPPDLPVNYRLVVGFEDMRLFARGHNLWTSSTVRQFAEDGIAEQVLARIGGPPGGETGSTLELADVYSMKRWPRLYEKNWSPFVYQPHHAVEPEVRFMYRPGHVVDDRGQDILVTDPPFVTGGFSGSSQLILVDGYWLGVVHEARYHMGTPHRYYQHRFVLYQQETFALKVVSKPFYFNDKVIEFAAGIATQGDDLIISYGWKDREARLARVSKQEVMKFIFVEGQHG